MKAIHVTHCLTEGMVANFITKPLQGSHFIKIHEYIIGNEVRAYQVLPKSVLGNHNLSCTQKHKSQAVEGTKQEHRIKDSDGSRGGHFLENIQETTLQATGGDDECTEQPEAKVLKTTGHESREPTNVLVITFTNSLILKSEPKLKLICLIRSIFCFPLSLRCAHVTNHPFTTTSR